MASCTFLFLILLIKMFIRNLITVPMLYIFVCRMLHFICIIVSLVVIGIVLNMLINYINDLFCSFTHHLSAISDGEDSGIMEDNSSSTPNSHCTLNATDRSF